VQFGFGQKFGHFGLLRRTREGRGRFLKKAAQKLFRLWAGGREASTAQVKKVFLLLFVHKK
jgi:hypothetical protein